MNWSNVGIHSYAKTGPDPIKKFQHRILLNAGIGLIAELKKGHVTEVIGQIPVLSKILR